MRGALGTRSGSKRDESVQEKLDRLGVDPIEIMALMAAGDAVSLGYLTQEEFDAAPTMGKDTDGRTCVLRPSGREVALGLLPPGLRGRMAQELAVYVHGKKAQRIEHANPDGSALQPGAGQVVIVRLPDNGRTA